MFAGEVRDATRRNTNLQDQLSNYVLGRNVLQLPLCCFKKLEDLLFGKSGIAGRHACTQTEVQSGDGRQSILPATELVSCYLHKLLLSLKDLEKQLLSLH